MPIFTQIMIGMRRITTRISVLIFMLAIVATNIKAQEIVFEKADSIFIEEIINRHNAQSYSTTGEKAVAIATEFIGKDYVAGTLDEHNTEPLFISCSKLDCTTFVELVLAIAMTADEGSTKFGDVCRNLETIRYRNGHNNGYSSRLHYISWWIADSAKLGIIEEITTQISCERQMLDLNFMSTHPDSYPLLKDNPEAIKEIEELEMPFRNTETAYVPKEKVASTEANKIKSGDIIAITTSIPGLDVTHIGFAHYHNGTLCLLHASSGKGEVIKETHPLYDYLAKNRRHTGIRVFRSCF